jgi:hypothetical protein
MIGSKQVVSITPCSCVWASACTRTCSHLPIYGVFGFPGLIISFLNSRNGKSSASSSHPASGYTRILHPSLSEATVPSIFPTLFLQSFGRYTGYHVSSLFPLPFFCHDVFEFLRQNDPLTTLRRDEYEMFCTSFFFFYGAYKCVARVYIVFFALKKSEA